MRALGAEQAVQTLAVIGGLDLLGVGGADGGDLVRVDEAGLHAVRGAVVLELVVSEDAVAQAEHILELVDAEHALVLQVVDGVDRLDIGIARQMRVLDLQQRGDHARLPVVGVDDVREEADQRQGVQHGTAEEAVTLVLVAAQTVDIAAAEVILVVDEIEGDAVLLQHLNAAVLLAPAKLDLEVDQVAHCVRIFLRDRGVQRQNDAHIMPFAGKNRRQRANNIRQSAGLDERHAFAGGKENLHG